MSQYHLRIWQVRGKYATPQGSQDRDGPRQAIQTNGETQISDINRDLE